ncbi:Uncharacterised protein [Mycobacteroides abscessus subsp. massiliense]|nr:Uncharacterised protein [Mycobacteroides abscessus subsp. massiliense]
MRFRCVDGTEGMPGDVCTEIVAVTILQIAESLGVGTACCFRNVGCRQRRSHRKHHVRQGFGDGDDVHDVRHPGLLE